MKKKQEKCVTCGKEYSNLLSLYQHDIDNKHKTFSIEAWARLGKSNILKSLGHKDMPNQREYVKHLQDENARMARILLTQKQATFNKTLPIPLTRRHNDILSTSFKIEGPTPNENISNVLHVNPLNFSSFCKAVKLTMEGPTPSDKGYNDDSVDGPNQFDQLVHKHFPGHSTGEIVYKAVRWQHKKDITDLVKIAAWAFLEWRNALRSKEGKI